MPPEYLAGFVDGEGYLGLARIRRRGRAPEYCLRVAAYNTNRGVLEEIRSRFGGTLSSIGQRRARWKPSHALIWTNASAADLIQKIQPFLRLKAKQAEALLEFQRHVRSSKRLRDSLGRLCSLTRREFRFREAFYRQVKQLNSRDNQIRKRYGHARSPRKSKVRVEYLAGFVDGEGSLLINKVRGRRNLSAQYRPRLAISNTDRRVLEDIRDLYGGILTHEPRAHLGWNDISQLVWVGRSLRPVLSAVLPHLRVKRRQAAVLLAFLRHLENTPKRRAGPNRSHFARLPQSVVGYRERLYQRMKVLNARGVRLPVDSHPRV